MPAAAAIAVTCADPALTDRARELAAALGLAVFDADAAQAAASVPALLLQVGTEGLALVVPAQPRVLPVRVDFADPALLRRLREAGARRQDLARAVGVSTRDGLRVVDATAGWGRDSAVLAALGCTVTMIERQPVVAALLADGLRRATLAEPAAVRAFAARLSLLPGDARALLRAWPGEPPDVVLLDPMFPARGKSAAVRKEMQLFHRLVGDDADAAELLEAALALAQLRVVVKRPLAAPPLGGRAPSHTIRGSAMRFDVHVLRGLAG